MQLQVTHVDGPAAFSARTVSDYPVRVGRGAGNDLQIEDSQISRRHLTIHRSAGDLLVEDHSKNGTTVDERTVHQKTSPLTLPSTLKLGRTRVRLTEKTGAPDETEAPDWFVLRLVEGDGRETTHELSDGECRIGRAADNDLRVLDRKVSRHHGTLIAEDGEAFFVDRSTNGTTVDGTYLHHGEVELEGETRLELGDAVVAVEPRNESSARSAGVTGGAATDGDVTQKVSQAEGRGRTTSPEEAERPRNASGRRAQEGSEPPRESQDRGTGEESEQQKSGASKPDGSSSSSDSAGRDAVREEVWRSKSYTGKAVLTMVAYWLGWLPGVIANFYFLSDAKRAQEIIGYSPQGKGCLQFLIWTHVYLPLLGLLIVLLFFGEMLQSLL